MYSVTVPVVVTVTTVTPVVTTFDVQLWWSQSVTVITVVVWAVWVVNEVIQSVLVLPVVTDDPGVVAGVDLVLEPVAVAGVDSVLEPGVVAGVDSILEPGVVAGVDPVDDATLLLLVALLVEIREDDVDETV